MLGVAGFAITAPAAQTAPRRPSNASATWSYLRAQYRFDRTVEANFTSSRAAADHAAGDVAASCPQVLAHAPAGPELDQIAVEITIAALVVPLEPDRRALHTVVDTVQHLRWRSKRVTALVQRDVRAGDALERMRQPNLCRDTSAWVASGYQTLPAATVALIRNFRRGVVIESGPGIEELLQRYERRRAAQFAQRLSKLEEGMGNRILRISERARKAFRRALGMPEPTSRPTSIDANASAATASQPKRANRT